VSPHVASALTVETGFTARFFGREPLEVPLGSLLFRGRTRITAAERRAAHRLGEIAFEVAVNLRQQLVRPEVRIPRMADVRLLDPARAASVTRSALGLDPTKPVVDLIRVLERAGVLVLSLPAEGGRHDAFSFWAGPDLDVPVIGVFRGVPPDRLRFSVAHELGHLVLHRAPTPNVEREAHAFASHFLLPDEAIHEFPRPLTLTDLARLKPRWRVAMQALVLAARRADAINEREKRLLLQQISRRGWRKAEPGSDAIPLERCRGLVVMAELLYGSPPSLTRIAGDFGLPQRLVHALLDEDVLLVALGETSLKPEPTQPPAEVIPLRRRSH
jgi:Zn-dependent peptidase ImmA (M78 family)